LVELDVSGNNLSTLPQELLQLPNLELLMTRDNYLLFKGLNKVNNLNLIEALKSRGIIVKYLVND
jgi:Leucine-rich repeat (LRR) protein